MGERAGATRRWLVAAALAGVLVVLPAGCSERVDVDGRIADDWRPIGEAEPFVPLAGACMSTGYTEVASLSSYNPVDCAEAHYTETVYVGLFPEAAAQAASPPAAGSPAMRAAYAECDKKARAYLGDDWRTARLWLGVTRPSPSAWTGGGRWYRCELVEVAPVGTFDEVQQRRGSLKGALTAASRLRLGCYTVRKGTGGGIGTMTPVGCATAHQAEFVGVYSAPDVAYPKADARESVFLDGCRAALATFVKVPYDSEIKFRSGVIWVPAKEAEWQGGDRGIRCYLWMDDRDLRRSMRDAGPSGLPVQLG
jgi:hypothetical protein